MQFWQSIGAGALLAGAIALLPAYRTAPNMNAHPPADVRQLTQAPQSLTGTVVGYGEVDENEWLLETERGVVRVDAGPRWYQTISLEMNEAVTIVGELDEGEFDAFTITRADGTVISVRPSQGPPPWAGGPRRQSRPAPNASVPSASVSMGNTTLTGEIIGYGEADENEWLVQTANGVVVVDAGDRDGQSIDLPIGETVTITGEYDASEFDAFTITRADGSVIQVLAWD